MLLFIEPLDVILFRDGKPFGAGDSFSAKTLFPPFPTAFVGAIRTATIISSGTSFKQYERAVKAINNKQEYQIPEQTLRLVEKIGRTNDYGQLQFVGPFLCSYKKNNPRKPLTLYFPAPLDAGLKGETAISLAVNKSVWPVKQNTQLLEIQNKAGEKEIPENSFLTLDEMKNYLLSFPFSVINDLWDIDVRTSIELTKSRTAEVGKFYSIEFATVRGKTDLPAQHLNVHQEQRMGFLLEVTGLDTLDLPENGFLSLGGENRIASYECLTNTNPIYNLKVAGTKNDWLSRKLLNKPRFKIYLATPVIFSNGWFPDFLDKSPTGEYVGAIGNFHFKLVAASVGKNLTLSGWDLIKQKPRITRKVVPAGSVYHFEKIGGNLDLQDVELLIENFHLKPLIAKDSIPQLSSIEEMPMSEYAKTGLGLSLIGS